MERCMLAEEYVGKEFSILKGWVGERKLDGTRCLYLDEHLVNRRGVCYDMQFPEVLEELRGYDADFDGELVVLREGVEDFGLCTTRCSTQSPLKIKLLMKEIPISYIVFDILRASKQDMKSKPLLERKKMLDIVLDDGLAHTRKAEYSTNLEEMWDRAVRQGHEGIMLKREDGKYVNERSDLWLKVKNRKVEAVKFNGMEKNPAGWLLTNDDGYRVQCAGRKAEAVRERFLESGQVEVEVHYQRRTESGLLFQPSIRFTGGANNPKCLR